MSDSSFDRELDAEAEIQEEEEEAVGRGKRSRAQRSLDSDDDEEEEQEEEEQEEEEQEEEEEEEEEEDGFHRQVESESESESFDGASTRGGPHSTSTRLHQGLDEVPGYSEEIMGSGIEAVPPGFETGVPDFWTQWSNEPFGIAQKLRPVRVLKVGFVPKFMMAKDAEYVGDFETQSDDMAQSRTIATCAMMGLQTMGTAKGFICSKNHSEITNAQAAGQGAMEEEDLKKLKEKFNGKLKSYTYCPNRTSSNQQEREETVPQFCWGLCYCYDEKEKFTGINYLMLIFDKSFSNEQLVAELMNENSAINAAGSLNGVPEHLRKQNLERQNKIQRAMTSGSDLSKDASSLYRRICTNSDYTKMLESVGGQTEGNKGCPYYANIQKDTPVGCTVQPFQKFVSEEFGGRHPFGPSVSHNHKRFLEPGALSPGHPGVNVHTAGMLDVKGKPLGIHSSLRDPRDWYDAEGNFEPPQHVRDNGWFYICHDPSVTNLFKAPLPHKMHGSVEPDDVLLKIFWDLNKDTSPILKKAQERGKHTFEDNRDTILSLFHREEDTIDPDQARLSRAVNDTSMLSNESLDKSHAEEVQIEHRAYGGNGKERNGDMYTISVRQILRDISQNQEKVHAMVEEHDKRARKLLRDQDYASQQAAYQVFDPKVETRRRQQQHAQATAAVVRLGLQRFEHAYERKKAQKMIPPGWRDVCHTGLRVALKAAGEVAARRAAAGLGRVVNPNDPNASVGTANIGQAFKKTLGATDFTTFGQSRAFLMYLFSAGVRIAGSDVKLMFESYLHAVRYPPPPSGLQDADACLLVRSTSREFGSLNTHMHTRTLTRALMRRFQDVSFFFLMYTEHFEP